MWFAMVALKKDFEVFIEELKEISVVMYLSVNNLQLHFHAILC